MKSRHVVFAVAALMLSMSLSSGAADAPSPQASPRRNVLFIVSDDLNCYLGCYGDPRAKTPNIDKLAARGVRFDRAYCAFPLCGPSRSSLLTGLYPNSTGIFANNEIFRQTIPKQHSMPQQFRLAGYVAVRIGKMYHYGVPNAIGSNGHDDPASWEIEMNPAGCDRAEEEPKIFTLGAKGNFGATPSWYASPKADAFHTDGMEADDAQWALERFALRKDRPFFLALGFFRPHTPYVAPKEPYFGLYPEKEMPLTSAIDKDLSDVPPPALGSYRIPEKFTPDLQRQGAQAYYAAISFMDAQVGHVVDTLDRLGLSDNTVIVFTSDHGYHIGEHGLWQKMSLFEVCARIPMLIVAPNMPNKGAVVKTPVAHVDLFPTLAELCGVPTPKNLQGQSLVPMINDTSTKGRGWALTVVTRNANQKSKKREEGGPYFGCTIRNARWRYTEWDEGRKGRELYDHDTDDAELTNLADNPSHANDVEEMSQQLHAAIKSSLPPSGKPPEIQPGMWSPQLFDD